MRAGLNPILLYFCLYNLTLTPAIRFFSMAYLFFHHVYSSVTILFVSVVLYQLKLLQKDQNNLCNKWRSVGLRVQCLRDEFLCTDCHKEFFSSEKEGF